MLRISLLGRPAVRYGDNFIAGAARPKVLPLLAYLLLHAGAERHHIAADLWPEYSDSEARANLRRHLAYLKQWLPKGAQWFHTAASHVRWNERSACSLDVDQFNRLSADPQRFEDAVALYGGDLCDGMEEPWLEEARRELAQRYTAMLAELAMSCRARRSLRDAVHWSRKLLAYDPWREDAIRQLMLAKYEAGDRAGAIAEYERFCERLREELQTDPMSETATIYEAIRRDIVPAGSLGAASIQSAPLSDLPLVGRMNELRELKRIWTEASAGEQRTAYVVGEAGIGKTRLLREFALQCEAGGGRVFWTAVSTPEQIPYEPFVELIKITLPFLETVELDDVWRSALADLVAERRPAKDSQLSKVERQRARLFEAVSLALIALSERRPVCVVIEDLHNARSGTLEMAGYVQRRLHRSKTLIALSYRDDEPHLPPELRQIRRESDQASSVDIPLRRLTEDDVARLLEAGSAGSDLPLTGVIEATDGNPLFVTEILRGGMPLAKDHSTFSQILLRRLDTLGARMRSLSRSCSNLHGRCFDRTPA